jgi:hypothetical protein
VAGDKEWAGVFDDTAGHFANSKPSKVLIFFRIPRVGPFGLGQEQLGHKLAGFLMEGVDLAALNATIVAEEFNATLRFFYLPGQFVHCGARGRDGKRKGKMVRNGGDLHSGAHQFFAESADVVAVGRQSCVKADDFRGVSLGLCSHVFKEVKLFPSILRPLFPLF